MLLHGVLRVLHVVVNFGDPGTHTRDRDYSEVDLECILHIYCQLVMLELLDEIVLSALQHRVLSTNIDLPQA